MGSGALSQSVPVNGKGKSEDALQLGANRGETEPLAEEWAPSFA